MPCNSSRIPDIAIEITPQSNHLVLVRQLMGGLAQQLQLNEIDAAHLEMCLDEACANSVDSMKKHGLAHPVRVEISIEENTVRFTICDNGHDYSQHFHQAQPMDALTDRTQRRGYGLRIIKTLMDEVDYFYDPQQGNRLHFVKHLSQK